MPPLFELSVLEKLTSSINRIPDSPSSRFPHLASTMLRPTREEIAIIKAIIQDSERQKTFTDNVLSQLKDIERAIRGRSDAFIQHQSQHRSMLSTLRSMPPEVLSDIFLRCLPDFDIDIYADFDLDHPPWNIARVCQKWRYVCLSTPLLWLRIPTVFLNREYKPGFFELLKTMMNLSFPYFVRLHLRDTTAETIQHFQHVLHRIHSLDVRVNLSMMKALLQRKESFKHLKSAEISFDFANSSDGPPNLDFLATVTSLTLSCPSSSELEGIDYPNPYALLRSVDFQWSNLTSFCGENLPTTYLRKVISAAPLLQKVTMHDVRDTYFDSSTADPVPTSIIYHTNLKDLRLTTDWSWYIPRETLQYLRLPGLQSFHIEHAGVHSAPLLSIIEHTHGSLLKLHLGEPLESKYKWTLYSLCPHLEELFLCYADAEDLKTLTISSDSRLCPALRCLSLPDFTLDDDDKVHILQEFLFSRGLVPFTGCRFPPDCRQLESVTILMDAEDRDTMSDFHRYCLKVNDRITLYYKKVNLWLISMFANINTYTFRLSWAVHVVT